MPHNAVLASGKSYLGIGALNPEADKDSKYPHPKRLASNFLAAKCSHIAVVGGQCIGKKIILLSRIGALNSEDLKYPRFEKKSNAM